jgi:Rieske Fe-S protein
MTARCSHAGCVLVKKPSILYCNCHGATYDLNGEHPTTPAVAGLVHFAVCVDAAGHVRVDTNQPVPAAVRA